MPYTARIEGRAWSIGPTATLPTITACRQWAEDYGDTADRCMITDHLGRLVGVHARDRNGTGRRWYRATYSPTSYAAPLVLCRSDHGDGGWSLHAPGSTDEDIASGDAPALLTGTARRGADSAWSRPSVRDYAAAHRAMIDTSTRSA